LKLSLLLLDVFKRLLLYGGGRRRRLWRPAATGKLVLCLSLIALGVVLVAFTELATLLVGHLHQPTNYYEKHSL
jgi:hypothetical protein